MWCFKNPVEIVSGHEALNSLNELVSGRAYSVVTYSNDIFSNYTREVIDAVGHHPVSIIDGVVENPHFVNLRGLCKQLSEQGEETEVFVALGGGSVMDTAKVLAASGGDFENVESLLKGRVDAQHLSIKEIIAVPTTAGTGSEVTHWGTVWDPENDAKYSLSDTRLYPSAAIVHAPFTSQLPVSITVSTALDALSHALESLWNKNRNPISAMFAVTASRAIIETLPLLVQDPTSLVLRTKIQEAALMAGLAFSNTKTSIAHNMSYAVTLDKGVAHGIACSFTLPAIIAAVDRNDHELIANIRTIFNSNIEQASEKLAAFLNDLGVAVSPKAYGYTRDEWQALVKEAALGQRGQNFSGNVEELISQF